MPRNSSTVDLKKNWETLKNEINIACRAALRDPNDVHIIAVSKGHDFHVIRELYHLGQRDFGENYALEFAHKKNLAIMENLVDIRFHFIGVIQSNKLKIIKDAHAIHSLGSLVHAQKLNEVLRNSVDVFLQINLDEDPKRLGFLENELKYAALFISELGNLNLRGLMAILPQTGHASHWFKKMVRHKQFMLAHGLMREVFLSMGMSNDFTEAIHHGADYLRIGTRIFGPR